MTFWCDVEPIVFAKKNKKTDHPVRFSVFNLPIVDKKSSSLDGCVVATFPTSAVADLEGSSFPFPNLPTASPNTNEPHAIATTVAVDTLMEGCLDICAQNNLSGKPFADDYKPLAWYMWHAVVSV